MCSEVASAWLADPFGICSEAALPPDWEGFAAGAAPPTSRGGLRDGSHCPQCGRAMEVIKAEYLCPACRCVVDGGDDGLDGAAPAAVAFPFVGRLRILGPEARFFQGDLDRLNPHDKAPEASKNSVRAELNMLNSAFQKSAGRSVPQNVIDRVVDLYYEFQQRGVHRSERKRAILAALLSRVGHTMNFDWPKPDIARLMQLRTMGLAQGEALVGRACEEFLPLEPNADPTRSFVRGALSEVSKIKGVRLHLPPDGGATPLEEAIVAILRQADALSVGISSCLRSRVVATVYVALRRTGKNVQLSDVAKSCKIRRPTIERFVDVVGAHHLKFVETFRAHGLDTAA